MSLSRWTSARPFALAGLTALLAVAALPATAAQGGGDEPDAVEVSGAAGSSTEVVTVEGTLVNLAVEPAVGDHAAGPVDDLVIDTLVEVDGALYPLPENVRVDAGVTGQEVEVALVADEDLAVADALAIATADAPVPGVGDETSAVGEQAEAAADLPAGEAEVLAVTTTGDPSAAAEVLAEGAVGSHTLTVLPVYWTAPDNQTSSTLGSLATQTAQYWSRQSDNRIALSTSVRSWARIPDPGSCDTPAIMKSALAANGLAASTATSHVLVYFPKMAACGGWAGLASIGGGSIWVNGTPIVDVFTHEFGHNLGLGHANTVTCQSGGVRVPYVGLAACTPHEYADTADVMGYAVAGRASGNLNTALADHLGLVTVVRPTTSAPVTVDLAPLGSVRATRSIAIPVPDGTIYVDFRPAVAPDTRQPAWAGVQVHLRTMDARYRYPTTYLLDMNAPATGEFAAPALHAGGTWSVPGTGLVVTVESVGSTARVSVAPGSGGASPAVVSVQAYIESVYRHLFQRDVDATGLQTWTTKLLNGTPRIAVANGITYSREYRSRLIRGSYQTYLGRSPDAVGLENWLRAMDRGLTIQQMEAGFLASQEYYGKAGGTDAGWVRKLYLHVLGRSPASSEVAHWVGVLSAGRNRDQVAMGFLLSTEHLTTVIDGYYVQLLGRHIDSRGKATWVTNIQNGRRVEEIIGGIVASDEYYNKA